MLNSAANTATARQPRYGSPYGASPRNDQKFVEAARVKAAPPMKPAVVQKVAHVPPPPVWADLPPLFHTNRWRTYLTAAEIPELKRVILPMLEKYWKMYMDYRFDYGYSPTEAIRHLLVVEQQQRAQDELVAKHKKYLKELGPDFQPTTEDIITGLSALVGGWGTSRKLNPIWDSSVPTFATCCGSMNRLAFPGHYPTAVPTDSHPTSHYRKVWYEQVMPGEQLKYEYPLHSERLVLEDAAFSVHMFWNDE